MLDKKDKNINLSLSIQISSVTCINIKSKLHHELNTSYIISK